MAAGKRNTNESFTSYRKRLQGEERSEKERTKGRVIWLSSKRGTYVTPRIS